MSVFAGLIAANLPDGSEVLTATGDFTSILFPFYAQSGRGIRVREVPLDRIAECVTSRTTLVAVSAVQSADGPVADLDALHAAALPPGPGCCWTPPRPSGGCRWTRAASPTPPAADTNGCSPPEAPPTSPSIPTLIDDLTPHHAGWYAGDDPWSSAYGGPLRLASDARRFDVSPAWHAWVAAAPAVRLLAQVGTQSLHRHALGLANRFRAGIGLEPADSAIVSLATNGAAAEAMAAVRIKHRPAPAASASPFTSPPATKTPTSPPTSCGGTSLPATRPRCDGRSYPRAKSPGSVQVPGRPGLDREAAHSGGFARVLGVCAVAEG